jgi:hypothetical protein
MHMRLTLTVVVIIVDILHGITVLAVGAGLFRRAIGIIDRFG